MHQDLTVRLDDATLRKAKVLAAKRSTSVSRLVADEIARLVREDEAYEQARVEALAELEFAMDLGSGSRLPAREGVARGGVGSAIRRHDPRDRRPPARSSLRRRDRRQPLRAGLG